MSNKSKLVQKTIAARKNVRNLAITSLPGDKCSVINLNSYKAPMMSRSKAVSTMRDFTEIKHEWSVLLCVFGRCPISGSYWKTLDVAPDGKIYSNQIENALRDKHEELLSNFNMSQFVSLGWIAKPTIGLFNNDEIYSLFDKLGAWDYLAKWEVSKQDESQ